MSKIKDIEGNIELKRKLICIDGMANTLLKQMQDIILELEKLSKEYTKEEFEFYIEKIMEIDEKIYKTKKIIDVEL